MIFVFAWFTSLTIIISRLLENMDSLMLLQMALLYYFFMAESEVTQSCPTLCDPMDWSLPNSSTHGIFQARILEWVTISFSRGSSWSRDQTLVSHKAGKFFLSEPPGKPSFMAERYTIDICATSSLSLHMLYLKKKKCLYTGV